MKELLKDVGEQLQMTFCVALDPFRPFSSAMSLKLQTGNRTIG